MSDHFSGISLSVILNKRTGPTEWKFTKLTLQSFGEKMEFLEAVCAIFDVIKFWSPTFHYRTWRVRCHTLPLLEYMRLIVIALPNGGLLARLTFIVEQIRKCIPFAWGMARLPNLSGPLFMVDKDKALVLRQITLCGSLRLHRTLLRHSLGISVNRVWIRSNTRRIIVWIVTRCWIVWHIVIWLSVADIILRTLTLSMDHFNILYSLSNIKCI